MYYKLAYSVKWRHTSVLDGKVSDVFFSRQVAKDSSRLQQSIDMFCCNELEKHYQPTHDRHITDQQAYRHR